MHSTRARTSARALVVRPALVFRREFHRESLLEPLQHPFGMTDGKHELSAIGIVETVHRESAHPRDLADAVLHVGIGMGSSGLDNTRQLFSARAAVNSAN
jgi:hypothetical protein